jgi:hypothetical protein
MQKRTFEKNFMMSCGSILACGLHEDCFKAVSMLMNILRPRADVPGRNQSKKRRGKGVPSGSRTCPDRLKL